MDPSLDGAPRANDRHVWRRYGRALVLGAIGASAAWYLLVMWQSGVPTASSQHTMNLIRVKTAAAKSKPSPKLVVIAGSSGQFGIRTELLEQRLGLPAYNMGLAAGLGLHHLLKVSRNVLVRGDVALLSLEYVLLSDLPRPEEAMLDFVFSRDPEYLDSLPWPARLRLVYAMTPSRLVQGIRGRLGSSLPATVGPYQVSTINANGDETRNRLEDQGPRGKQRVASAQINHETLNRIEDRGGPAHDELAAFRDWCRDRGITLFATYPSTMDFPEYHVSTGSSLLDRATAIYRDLSIPALGSPAEFLYPRDWFFDTAEHLHAGAMQRHTERLVGLLQPVLTTRPSSASPDRLSRRETNRR